MMKHEMTNKNPQCELKYNVHIKPRGCGKAYEIKQEMRKLNGK